MMIFFNSFFEILLYNNTRLLIYIINQQLNLLSNILINININDYYLILFKLFNINIKTN
jgi:hypothetical protein